ncbi:hypothetical protein EDD11_001477 [Mortierella claussenii]|nr:hypothetical protein EDD11_001477 [Mortierella claussenii]
MSPLSKPERISKTVQFISDRTTGHDSDPDSDALDLPESSKTRQEDPDYYDPVYFDSDDYEEDEEEEEEDETGTGGRQDKDEMEYDIRAGIVKGNLDTAKDSSIHVGMKDIISGFAQSSLEPTSHTTPPPLATISKKSKASKRQQKHRALSDAELLYDPEEDDRDQDWLIKKIAANRPPGCRPEDIWTDAILSCPMCLTQLCFDCQQHELYPHQFRAMFVEHCRVLDKEILRFPKEMAQNKKTTSSAKSKKSSAAAAGSSSTSTAVSQGTLDPPVHQFKTTPEDDQDMIYHPVVCEICNTKVALMDQDEVYHFFNIIPAEV